MAHLQAAGHQAVVQLDLLTAHLQVAGLQEVEEVQADGHQAVVHQALLTAHLQVDGRQVEVAGKTNNEKLWCFQHKKKPKFQNNVSHVM